MNTVVDWKKYGELEGDKIKQLEFPAVFRKFALDLLDAPYHWGGENIMGSDCSGTVCYPLLCMGYNIRTTADDLMKRLFTKYVADASDQETVMAVFYVTESEKKHGDKIVKEGTAVHVTPVVGRYVVLNAGDPIMLATARSIRQWYESKGSSAVWRALDMNKLELFHKKGNMSYGVDGILKQYLKGAV